MLDSSAPIQDVVITHRGYRPYLPTCLSRAKMSANGGRVILLGDAANQDINIGEHHSVDSEHLRTDVDELRSCYRQVGRSQEFTRERFWVERWFHIRNLMRAEGLDGCLAIDSDVLLFCDVGQESLRFCSYAMTFGRWDAVRIVPHCNFIRGLAGLESFCDYVMDVYRQPARLQRLAEINRTKFGHAWVCDMSLLAAWGAEGNFPVAYLENTVANGVGFDACIDNTDDYVSSGYLPGILRQWKKVTFRDGVPYATVRSNRLEVPMKCLHYHGRFKLLMDRHHAEQSDDWSAVSALLKAKFGDTPRKLKLFARNYLTPSFMRSKNQQGAEQPVDKGV